MKNARILILALFLFCPGQAVFADTTVKAEVDKNVITAGELLTYKFTVASTEKNILPAKIHGFKGFAIVSQAQSSTVSFTKGGMQTILVFVFILLPRETGKLNIEPVQVTVNGKVYSSQGAQVEVKRVSALIPPQKKSKFRLPGKPQPQDSEPEIPDSDQPQYNL